MKALRVLLATGETITTEAGEGRCWASEEVGSVEIEVGDFERCDLCGIEIDPRAREDDVRERTEER